MVAGSLSQAAKLDRTGKRRGTLPNALDLIFKQVGAIVVVVRVQEGDNENTTLTNILGGVNANGAYEGVHAFIGAQSIVGQTPRILIAPGFTNKRTTTDLSIEGLDYQDEPLVTVESYGIAAELIGIAERLRAIVVLDAPNTTDEAALSTAKDFDSKRAILIDPFVKVNRDGKILEEPASAAVAGVIAKTDFTHGFLAFPFQ